LQNVVEVDHIVGDATARELEKLRNYVANHRGEINAKFGDNLNKHALLNRFADGDYLGIPYSDNRMLFTNGRRTKKLNDGNGMSFMGKIARVAGVVIILAAIIIINCLVVSDLK
jgi:hypothetical protein